MLVPDEVKKHWLIPGVVASLIATGICIVGGWALTEAWTTIQPAAPNDFALNELSAPRPKINFRDCYQCNFKMDRPDRENPVIIPGMGSINERPVPQKTIPVPTPDYGLSLGAALNGEEFQSASAMRYEHHSRLPEPSTKFELTQRETCFTLSSNYKLHMKQDASRNVLRIDLLRLKKAGCDTLQNRHRKGVSR